MTAKRFKIAIPEEVLDDLQERLSRTRWTDEAPGSGWDMGTDLDYMKSLVEYWKDGYDWRKHERDLNMLENFHVEIDGTELHFIHQKSEKKNAPAILLLHGWPDSFYRFHKVIPKLAEHYDVVVPSLPGFGFSGHTAMPSASTADLLASLMIEELGYKQFAVTGGDISTAIVHTLASDYEPHLTAVYLTDAGYPNGTEDFKTMTPAEQEFAGRSQRWWYMEGAYNMEQSTKPQTVGYGLTDSPVGLAAWMVEKFHAWTGSPEDLDDHFTKDEILTNIMIYWVTGTITSSMRTYLENTRAAYAAGGPAPMERTEVPAAIGAFPTENVPVPREWAERAFNVQRFTELPRGGHFSALEEPGLFTADVSEAVKQLTS